jgi:hypothetical protein
MATLRERGVMDWLGVPVSDLSLIPSIAFEVEGLVGCAAVVVRVHSSALEWTRTTSGQRISGDLSAMSLLIGVRALGPAIPAPVTGARTLARLF